MVCDKDNSVARCAACSIIMGGEFMPVESGSLVTCNLCHEDLKKFGFAVLPVEGAATPVIIMLDSDAQVVSLKTSDLNRILLGNFSRQDKYKEVINLATSKALLRQC